MHAATTDSRSSKLDLHWNCWAARAPAASSSTARSVSDLQSTLRCRQPIRPMKMATHAERLHGERSVTLMSRSYCTLGCAVKPPGPSPRKGGGAKVYTVQWTRKLPGRAGYQPCLLAAIHESGISLGGRPSCANRARQVELNQTHVGVTRNRVAEVWVRGFRVTRTSNH